MTNLRRSARPSTLIIVIAAIAIVACGCCGGLTILWMMMGSPWPIDLSAFAE